MNGLRWCAMTGTLLITLLHGVCQAAPVPDDQRLPLDLRRTTLVIRDMDRSLALYRDALGMKVAYDNLIRTPRDATSNEQAERAVRLVLLQANDDFVGMLGLLQYLKPNKSQPVSDLTFEPGSVVLVFNVKDLDQRLEKVRATAGAKVVGEPSLTSYPSYDGKGTIPVRVSVVKDPDGFVLELNQLMVDKVR